MKYTITVLVVVLLAMSLTSVYAGNTRRLGTAGAQELVIPVGSRSTSMGGAVIADVYGVESMHWNPAGLAYLSGTEAMFTYLPYLADINVHFVGMATNVEGFGSIGAAAKIVSIGDMEETTWENPDGTGRIYNPTLSVISVTYSRIMTERVAVGLTAKLIYEKIFEASAAGVAFDLGFHYEPGWRGLALGLTIQNYGPDMRFAGDGFNRSLEGREAAPKSASFDLPSSFNMGASYDFVDYESSVVTASGNFRSNNYSQDYWQGGLEYTYRDRYSLRGGYNFADQDGWLYGVSFGGGLVFDVGNTKLTLEYSWTETDLFDDNQYFTVKFDF